MEVKNIIRRMTDAVSETFDIPARVAGGQPRVTVTGNGKVNIENHRGLLEYDLDGVVVNTETGIVRIRGENITLTAMSETELVASGRIISAEFIM